MKKYSGLGNSFLILFEDELSEDRVSFIRNNVGDLDGFIFVGKESDLYVMNYYNRDGSYAEYCGNGARCFLRFLYDEGIVMKSERIHFKIKARVLEGMITDKDTEIMVEMPPIEDKGKLTIEEFSGSFIITGVPHFVIELPSVDKLENFPVDEIGRLLSSNKSFISGANVNLYSIVNKDLIRIRTYERGVERETMACGTGSVSSAYVYMKKYGSESEFINVQTNGGMLKVHFNKNKIFLIGGVENV